MKIKPLGERVLLRKPDPETKTKGGIYIPENANEDKKEGVVVAVGETKDGKELPLKKGDRVIYGGYSDEEINIDGQDYIFVEYKNILAKYEE